MIYVRHRHETNCVKFVDQWKRGNFEEYEQYKKGVPLLFVLWFFKVCTL